MPVPTGDEVSLSGEEERMGEAQARAWDGAISSTFREGFPVRYFPGTQRAKRGTMMRTGSVKPGGLTVLQAKTGIVVFTLFLVFGLAVGGISFQDAPSSETGLRIVMVGFFLIWVTVCISAIVFYLRLLSKPHNPGDNSLVDIHFEGPDEVGSQGGGNFAERLRQLEALKRDGLISEAEFQDKRGQILEEKW